MKDLFPDIGRLASSVMNSDKLLTVDHFLSIDETERVHLHLGQLLSIPGPIEGKI